MHMIHSHLIARNPVTPVYLLPEEGAVPAFLLDRGSWLGVLSSQGDWLHVIGIECDGWVRREDVENLPPMKLHIQFTPGKPLAYVYQGNGGR